MSKNQKIINTVIFTTDTPHHQYFIKYLKKRVRFLEIKKVFFERKTLNNFSLFKKFFFQTFPNIFKGLFLNPYVQINLFERYLKRYEEKWFNQLINDNIEKQIFSFVYDINSNKVKKYLNNNNLDLVIIYGTSKVKKEIYNTTTYGALNAHGGFLPAYRGLDTNLWAIFNNEVDMVYSTLHKVEEKFDSGEVVAEKKLSKKKINFFKLRFYITIDICKIIEKAVVNLICNKKIKKNDMESRYYKPMPILIKIWVFVKIILKKYE